MQTAPDQNLPARQDSPGEARAANDHLPVIQENAATLNDLIDISCRKYRDLPAVGMALQEPLSYKALHERILALAALLRESGVKQHDRVAILGENSPNWVIAYLAVLRLGAVTVPIFPDSPDADVQHILREMDCDFLFSTQRQIEKVYELKQQLRQVITLDDYEDQTGLVQSHTFSSLLDRAMEQFGEKAGNETLSFPRVERTDLAAILYTSGTSGFSKAVLLCHSNLCANAYSANSLIDIQPGWVFLSVLPLAHTYEFTVGFLLPMVSGSRVVYAGKAPTPAVLQRICAKEQPHAMLIVPLVMEKIYKKRIVPAIEKSRVLHFFCKFGLGRKLIHRKIGARLLDFFGNRLVVVGIGGAALNPEVELFLRDAEFPFIVGYGLTEAAPLLTGGPYGDTTISQGSTGKPVPNVRIRIADPDPETGIGEIEADGPNIMEGYLNDPEGTREVFSEDGWLKTGDLGCFDDQGNLHIRGRSKSVIVLSHGENVYPEAIEHKINAYPFIVESLVVEHQGQLVVWVYPDYEFIDSQTVGQSRVQRYRYLADLLEEMRTTVNSQLPVTSRLTRILERREPFVKTATHKIKRYLYSADTITG
ncbi:MAG: AMP-binding protein [Desulfobulbus sp.]|jgi:long-chain acyl-CoA synthetase